MLFRSQAVHADAAGAAIGDIVELTITACHANSLAGTVTGCAPHSAAPETIGVGA